MTGVTILRPAAGEVSFRSIGAALSLDETQIKQGSPSEAWSDLAADRSLAPLKTDVEPVAYQRAPTLMAGVSAGSQGPVRVWAPSRKLLWRLAIGSGAASVLMLLFSGSARLEDGSGFYFSIYVIWMILFFFASVSALRRPGYITTDDAGIGITTRKGSLPLQWNEIKAIRRAVGADEIILLVPDRVDLNSQGRIVLSLRGYPPALRKELVALIAERSGLKAPESHDPQLLFVRPGYSVFNNWCTPVAELKTGSETAGENLAPEE